MPFRRTPFVLAAVLAAAVAPAGLALTAGEDPPERGGPGTERGPGGDTPQGTGERPERGGEKPGDDGEGVEGRDRPETPKPRARGRAKYELKGVVTRAARRRAVTVEMLSGNRAFRDALRRGQEADEGSPAGGEAGEEIGGTIRVRISRRTVILAPRPGKAGKPAPGRAKGDRPKAGKPGDDPTVDKPEAARAHERGSGRSRSRRVGHRALRKGDKVVVTWIARRGLRVGALPPAHRIVDHGPRGAGHPGRKPAGVHTTNADGTAAFVRRYASVDAVYLNGGRTCATGEKRVKPLLDGVYRFQVTAGDGETTLSTASIEDRSFTVADGAVTSATAPTNPLACGKDGAVVKVGPFEVSEDGVYKLWVSRAGDVEEGEFDHRRSKKIVFRVGEPEEETPVAG